MYRKGDIGSPYLRPIETLKLLEGEPFTGMAEKDVETKFITQPT
jgi:hypothetical protein